MTNKKTIEPVVDHVHSDDEWFEDIGMTLVTESGVHPDPTAYGHARPGYEYCCADGPDKESAEMNIAKRLGEGWQIAARVGHTDVTPPAKGPHTVVMTMPTSIYKKYYRAKKDARNKKLYDRQRGLEGIKTTAPDGKNTERTVTYTN